MPRRREIAKRRVAPDPKYHDTVASSFINAMMHSGKKSVAMRLFYEAMDMVSQRSKEDPIKVFRQAVDNVKPSVEVKSRRVGGSTYQVPVEVRPDRRQALGIRWLIGYARSRGEKAFAERLAAEILDAYNNRGSSVKKREDTHKMAEANKAYAHYRW
jgi:small subunit ribosomal protein S7